MKKIFLLGALLPILFSCSQTDNIVGVTSDKSDEKTAHGSSAWHNLTSAEKEARIICEAFVDLGDYVGLSCKEWVRAVVTRASYNHVPLPATASNLYSWQADYTGHIMGYSKAIQNTVTGDIIQMKRNNGTPHTAIVTGKTSSGMYWIHSNWSSYNTVSQTFISYSYFNTNYGTNYTIYRIE